MYEKIQNNSQINKKTDPIFGDLFIIKNKNLQKEKEKNDKREYIRPKNSSINGKNN